MRNQRSFIWNVVVHQLMTKDSLESSHVMMKRIKESRVVLTSTINGNQPSALVQVTMEELVGQSTQVTIAKNSNADFELKEGMEVGAKVTLRRKVFDDWLLIVANQLLPRVKRQRQVLIGKTESESRISFGIENLEVVSHLTSVDKIGVNQYYTSPILGYLQLPINNEST